MKIDVSKFPSEVIYSLNNYFLKLEVIQLLEKIQGVSFNEIKIHELDPALTVWDYVSADGIEFYLGNLTEAPYFNRLFDCLQILKDCTFSKNTLNQEKLGFDRCLTNFQEKN